MRDGYLFKRRYCGAVKALIVDWAGTVIDFGSRAPAGVFVDVYQRHGVEISAAEARAPMGMEKRDHIAAIAAMPGVAERWQRANGSELSAADIDRMYDEFLPLQLECLPRYADLIPGTLGIVAACRARGIKIGSSTGYARALMDVVAAEAKQRGFTPEAIVCADDVPQGRPAPWMCFANLQQLGVWPVESAIKIDDTAPGIDALAREGALFLDATSPSTWSLPSHASLFTGRYPSSHAAHAEPRGARCAVGRGARRPHPPRLRPPLPRRRALRHQLDRRSAPRARVHRAPPRSRRTPLSAPPTRPARTPPMDADIPYLLLTPGPLTTSRRVREAMLADYSTWDVDYNSIVEEVRAELVMLAGDPSLLTCTLMQGSGTFAVEAAIGSAVPRDGRIAIVNNGAYGKRMVEIAQRLGIDCVEIAFAETELADPQRIAAVLDDDPAITHLAMAHCETTTGMLNPAEAVGAVVRARGRLFILDAMSSFGGVDMTMDSVAADFLISSANKCVQGVPGFGFVLAPRARMEAIRGQARSLSLDLWDQWREMEEKGGKWRYTSPTHTVVAFRQALRELAEEGGVAARAQRYRDNHRRLVDGMRALGFRTLVRDEWQSPIITSFHYPEDPRFTFDEFYDRLKRRRFVIYPGKVSQAACFRIGTIGHVFPGDIDELLEAIDAVRGEMGLSLT